MLKKIQRLLGFYKPRELQVIVTGPPRSGTSFLCGLVQHMGFHAGPETSLRQANEHNPYGYYEYLPLLKISDEILRKFGGDFHLNIPQLPINWTNKLEKEKRKILQLVNEGQLSLYKDNRLLVLANLYHELYPDARWIFINRNIEDTFRSRGGKGKSYTFEQWQSITENRLRHWHISQPSHQALNLDYDDFHRDTQQAIFKIQSFLELQLSDSQNEAALNFFKPREER